MSGLSSIRRRAGRILRGHLETDAGRADLLSGMAARTTGDVMVSVMPGMEAEFEVMFRIMESHRSDPRALEAALGTDMALAVGLWICGINPLMGNVASGQVEGLRVELDLTASPCASVGGLEWTSDQEWGSYHSLRGEMYARLYVTAPLIYEAWMRQASVPAGSVDA